jgi:hypothetical protein
MRIEGVIVPTGDASGFTWEAWCTLVSRRPEFRRPSLRQVTNPFTRQPATVRPRPDIAEVLLEGRTVGDVWWSLSEEEPLVNVSIEPSAMPMVLEWAAELGGKFQPASLETAVDS